jgi:hypothetical protein
MTLAPQEREKLAAIETQFRATDPRFATMFQLLDKLGRHAKGAHLVFLSVWLARTGWAAALVLLATTATLIAAPVVVAALLA